MKTCPFLNKECIKEECQIWHPMKKNCSVVAIVSELQMQSANEAAKQRGNLPTMFK